MPVGHVIMGDVTASSAQPGEAVMAALTAAVDRVNAALGENILSPLTITLGDEFQGVAASHAAMVEAVLAFEDMRLRGSLPLRLRYALAVGEIETGLNPVRAHAMLGPALTLARKRLTDKRADRPRVAVTMDDPDAAQALERTFAVLMRRLDDWQGDEGPYIADILAGAEVAGIAATHGRDETTVYRRRKTAPVRDAFDLRAACRAHAAFLDRSAPWS